DKAYLFLDFTSNHEDLMTNTPYPERSICRMHVAVEEYSRRYLSWSPLQETPICLMLPQETYNPGTTMEEYVQFDIERALKNGKVYNWETAKYGMTNWYLEDVDINILIFFEPKFPAIIYNDALKL
ncbi:hypothetical protein Tco_0637336, partial [Tanacetum coccineum]